MSGPPEGWKTLKLGKVIELKYGKSLPQKSRASGPYQVYGSNGPVGSHSHPLTAGITIIVGRKGSIGEIHLSRAPCFPIDTTYYIDEFSSVRPEFAVALLKTLELGEINRASAIPGLNRTEVYDLDVDIPPLSEQHRIAAKLDSLNTRTARARERLGRILKLIQKYREAILAQAFSGDLTKEWRRANRVHAPIMSTLGAQVSDISYGTAKKCHSDRKGVPVLRIPNVAAGKIDLSDLKFADFEERELAKLRLQDGDILIVRSNGSADLVGKPALVEDFAIGLAYAGYLIRLRPKTGAALPRFLRAMLQAPQVRRVIETNARSTSGVHNINAKELAALEIPKAAIQEQGEIVRRVETAFAWLDRMAAEHDNASRLLPRLDQAILTKAFRGDLVCSANVAEGE